MKRCTQCEFIYEDDQSLCDMDGKELVYDAGPIAFAGGFSSTSTNIQANAAKKPASLRAPSQLRRFAVLALAGVLLAALLFVVYYALTNRSRASNRNQSSNQTSDHSLDQSPNQSPGQSAPRADATQSSATELAAAPSVSLTETTSLEQLAEQSSSSPANLMPNSPTPSSSRRAKSLTNVRLAPGSVSAGGSPKSSHAPVIIRLNNGASIRADEAWERKEGIWYRQAGMVTFLKRNKVRAIERLASSPPPTLKIEETKRKPENIVAKNQSTLVNQENSNVKNESRMKSFLKKTGRILKKPFKF